MAQSAADFEDPRSDPDGHTGEEMLRPLGRYILIARLGRGGMGNAFLAVMRGPAGFNKLLVVKTLLPELARNPTFLEMFLQEARICARLSHPNVVQTYEIAQEDGEYFLVMDYLEGCPFSDLMALPEKKRPPLRLSLRILLDVLEGLSYAHDLADLDGSPLNLVHRDVSPQNIFITYQGIAKLFDFGVAKSVTSAGATKSGVVKGKYGYMAPEQARGEAVDARSDIFSLGIILWELIVGRRMMEGSSEPVQIAARIHGEEPDLLEANPEADPKLAAICDQAIAHRPKDRFADAQQMHRVLEAYLVESGPLPTKAEVGKWMRKRYAEKLARVRALTERQVRLVQSWVSNEKIDVPMLEIGGVSPPVTSSTSVRTKMEVPSRTDGKGLRRRSLLGVGLALGSAGLLLIAYLALSDRAPSGPAVERRPVASRPVASASQPVARDAGRAARPDVRATILVEISIRPRRATLILDGQPLDSNPYRADLPRDDRLHTLELRAPGHLGETRQLRFTRDISLEIGLRRRPSAARSVGKAKTDKTDKTEKPDKPEKTDKTARPQPPAIDTDNPYK